MSENISENGKISFLSNIENLKKVVPNQYRVMRIEKKSLFNKDVPESSKLFKDKIYAEHFLTVMTLNDKLKVGFDWNSSGEGNAVEIINKLEKEETRNIFVIRPYITRHGNGPIPSMKDVIEVNDPNNKFNEFQKTMRCIKFDSKLLEHVVIVNSIYRVPGSSNMLYLTHSDETNDSFFKDFDLSMFNRVYKSFYDSSIFYDTKSL